MTQPPLLPGMGFAETTFTCPPDSVMCHPAINEDGRGAVRRLVTWALVALAEDERRERRGDGYSTRATRRAICALTGLGVQSVYQSLRWLMEIGVIEMRSDPSTSSGRCIVFLWRRVQAEGGARQAHGAARAPAHGGVRQEAPGARAPAHGGARPGALPSYREKTEREKETSNVPGIRPGNQGGPPPAASPFEGGRDGDVERSGGSRTDKARTLRATLRSEAGLVMALEGDAITLKIPQGTPAALAVRRDEVLDAAARAAIADLKPELVKLLREESLPAAAGAPPPARRRIDPDPSVPLAAVLGTARLLGNPDRFAEAAARRYRDPNPETREHYRAAAALLAPGELEGIIKDTERDAIKNKARYLTSQLSSAMRASRQRMKKPAVGPPQRTPTAGA